MHLLYRSNSFWKAPWKSSCVSMSMSFVTASFISSIVSPTLTLTLTFGQSTLVFWLPYSSHTSHYSLQKRMECFRLLLEHLAWIKYQFLSGIRDSRKARSFLGMMRGVGGVRKLIDQTWLAKGLRLGSLYWGFKEFRKTFCRKRPALLKSGQCHFHQDNAPVHNSILVTDYLTKMGINTFRHPPSSPDVAPCDFWLFPKLTGCRYETIEEMKEAVTKVVDTLTHEDFHGVFQKGTRVSCGYYQ